MVKQVKFDLAELVSTTCRDCGKLGVCSLQDNTLKYCFDHFIERCGVDRAVQAANDCLFLYMTINDEALPHIMCSNGKYYLAHNGDVSVGVSLDALIHGTIKNFKSRILGS